MEQNKRFFRLCGSVAAFMLLLWLNATGYLTPVTRFLTGPGAAAVFFFLETGHTLRPVPAPAQTVPPETESTQPTRSPETTPPETTLSTQPPDTGPPAVAVFSPGDAALVEVNNYCGYDPQVESWLANPLSWDLTGDAPTVLILHSHGSESYENTENYTASSPYRCLDANYNMISVGDALVQLLEVRGIQALHDRQLHDYPSYSDAYENARSSIRQQLDTHPSIRLILDLHRDSVADSRGKQIGYTVETPTGKAAQLMLVVGTDAGGLSHTKWPENMSLAVKFHAQLEKQQPGICRPISFRTQRFNQDLLTGALLIEVGSAGNTRQEALAAAEILANAIAALSKGTG